MEKPKAYLKYYFARRDGKLIIDSLPCIEGKEVREPPFFVKWYELGDIVEWVLPDFLKSQSIAECAISNEWNYYGCYGLKAFIYYGEDLKMRREFLATNNYERGEDPDSGRLPYRPYDVVEPDTLSYLFWEIKHFLIRNHMLVRIREDADTQKVLSKVPDWKKYIDGYLVKEDNEAR